MYKVIFPLATLFSIVSCGSETSDDGNGLCPLVVSPAIEARIFEMESANPLCGTEALLIDGEYSEVMTIFEGESCSSAVAQGGFERPGSYQIIVSKEGFETWSSEQITVESNACGVETKSIDIYLVKMQ